MKILVTGSEGFLGPYVVDKIIEAGHEPLLYDLVDGNDILDYYRLLTAAQRATVVIHLAAATGLPFSNDNPYYYYRTNVEGTAVVARVCSNLKIPMVIASTGDAIVKNSHYSASKYAAERVVEVEGVVRGLSYGIIRILNLYGVHMPENYVVPKFIRQCQKGKPLTLDGGGKQSKDFVYVSDVAKFFVETALSLYEQKPTDQIVTIGSGVQTSILKVAETIKRLTESTSELIVTTSTRTGEAPETKVENFHVLPDAIGIEEGIKRIVESMKP